MHSNIITSDYQNIILKTTTSISNTTLLHGLQLSKDKYVTNSRKISHPSDGSVVLILSSVVLILRVLRIFLCLLIYFQNYVTFCRMNVFCLLNSLSILSVLKLFS